MTTKSPHDGLWSTFRTPLTLALISLAGLIGALLAEGGLDLILTFAVAVPLLTVAACVFIAVSRR
ncbi:hypothetical protein [Caulobacter sp. BP25]|uniref:hypothetical protein n=1 Tax=Caulobacter sp. BP25 TaxID=2048900 RepID=UPI000C12B322|nr:hypothetical protein [Caulobacter sp. BP25]PHY18121.1 hypothetical protein CSW59_15215 [Caulobacter sp. BP25]